MNKKAQGHVEVILSFVLFIGFLVFFFYIINPFSTKTNDNSLEIVKDAIFQNITTEIGELSIITEKTDVCYKFSNTYGLNFLEIKNNARKYTLYFSDLLNNNHANYNSNCAENSTLGVYAIKDEVIIENILKLKTSYEFDYSALKNSLGINKDFVFDFKENNIIVPELSVSKIIPSGINVDSNDYFIVAMDSQGNFRELKLNIRIW